MSSLTLFTKKVPKDYFSEENVRKIKLEIAYNLYNNFNIPIYVDDASILRVMHRVLDERLEDKEKMFQRVVMEICNEYKTYQLEKVKHLRWERFYPFVKNVYDVSSRSGPDLQSIKLSPTPSTLRFYYSYGF